MNKKNLRKFCIAPMMGYTTPHARNLYRILSKNSFLFTEMIPSGTMLHSKNIENIIENNNHNPIALQVGGSNHRDLAKCTKIASRHSYDEINLNLGCPSKAVQKGRFGACLMKESELVSNCLDSMLNSSDIKVTVKCRIGIDNNTDYDFFYNFINKIQETGVTTIYIHARSAFLKGLSPKNNRTIPPLKYDYVMKIKENFPNIEFILNGGIDSLDKAKKLTNKYDGVMVGRLIQNNPFCLSKVDEIFFNEVCNKNKYNIIIGEYFQYIKARLNKDSIYRLLSPLLNIFFGVPNSKQFRSEINEKMRNHEIDKLENLFLKFVNEKTESI